MLPIARQARYLGRYRQIAQVFAQHGFGYLLQELGLVKLLSLPRVLIKRSPPPAPLSVAGRLRMALIDLGPTFVKLGQVLSTRPDLLPPEFVTELNKLQDTVPPFPGNVAIATIEAELGHPVQKLFREFCIEPLAAASLGQVHAAVLHTGEHVVVKVQRPGISSVINTDLAIISDLAQLAHERTEFGTEYDLVDLAWEFNAMIRAEMDYRREASNAERFRRNFEKNKAVYIPKIYWEYTSNRVVTMERLYGPKINDLPGLERNGIDRRVLACSCVELILEEIFEHSFFHGDPHPGNFFGLRGGIVGAIDFGQVGTLDRDLTRKYLLFVLALVDKDTDGVLRGLEQMQVLQRRSVTPALRRDTQRFIDRFADRPLSEMSMRETGDELLSIARRHRFHLPAPVAMLLKTLIMMEGVGLQLDPQLNFFRIARPYLQQAVASQYAPSAVARRLIGTGSEISETLLSLPLQLQDTLHRLNEGQLRVQTQEQELRRVSATLTNTANRLVLAIILASIIIGLGMLAIALSVGGWRSSLLSTIGTLGSIIGLLVTVLLALALLRKGDS